MQSDCNAKGCLSQDTQEKFARLLKSEQLEREPGDRNFNPIDPPNDLFQSNGNSKNISEVETSADPINFLYNVWALPYKENQLENTDASYRFIATDNEHNLAPTNNPILPVVERDNLPVKTAQFIQENNQYNISVSLHASKEPRSFSKDNFLWSKCFALDLDLYKSNKDLDNNWIIKRLDEYDIKPPHFITHSSKEGRQLIWLTYTEGVDRHENILRDRKTLLDKFTKRVFPFADDISAVQNFRLPGTHNRKENRDDFEVYYEIHADTKDKYGFYTDLFDPLYDEHDLTNEELKEVQSTNNGFKHPENPMDHKVIKEYKKRLEGYKGYNPARLLTGCVLALKAIGKDKDEIEKILLQWIDKEFRNTLEDSLQYAFSGKGAEGQINGHGWDHRRCRLNLSNDHLKDFYNYIDNVKRTYQSERKYLNLEERRKKYYSYFRSQLVAGKNEVKLSFKDIADKSGVPESSIRKDFKNGVMEPYISGIIEHGKTTLWILSTTELNNSAKFTLDYVCVVGLGCVYNRDNSLNIDKAYFSGFI